MPISLNRRNLIAGLAAAGALPGCATSQEEARANPVFLHGVASGDPDADSIVLWTRISGAAQPERVLWEVSEDEAFARILLQGEAVAAADTDFTVKVIAGPLPAGPRLFFRFTAGGEVSPVGRTRLFHSSGDARLGIALASCSNFAFGFFNAYDAIARDPEVDLVLHTGDYIYEYGAGGWGDETGLALGRRHQPPHEIVSLADYRARHAQYKTDAGAQAMHAAHPFVACWDDHEVTNNPWTGGAQNHQPETEGDYLARRAAALQAYYEWMPVRDPGPAGGREAFWRSYRLGALATLVTLESRHTGRSQQVEYADHFQSIQTKQDRDRFMSQLIGKPDREMLSDEMEQFFASAMQVSVNAGEPWRFVGNASPIARMLVPDIAAAGISDDLAPPAERQGAGPNLFWKGKWNLPFYTDTWDGYPAARERLFAQATASGANDLIFLTGDSHSFWENEIFDAQNRAMGVELGTAGISSPGDFVDTGWKGDAPARLNILFAEALPEVNWTEDSYQGYVRVVFTASQADVNFMAVDNCLTTRYELRSLRRTRIVRGGQTLRLQPES